MAGVSLTQHPLAVKLQRCDSLEAITSLLQDQAQAFRHLQGSDKIMKFLKMTVSILSKPSSAAPLADAFGLVRQKGLLACLTSLTFICRHSHLRRRYRLVSLSYSTYDDSAALGVRIGSSGYGPTPHRARRRRGSPELGRDDPTASRVRKGTSGCGPAPHRAPRQRDSPEQGRDDFNCIGHPSGVIWVLPGSSSSTAPTQQLRARTGRLRCIWRPNKVM